jgi:hypothetical protein
MTLGLITTLDTVGEMPSAPLFADRISFKGDNSYPSGGTPGFSALLQALTKDKRTPLAAIIQDAGGAYSVGYNDTPSAGTSGSATAANAATYALTNAWTIQVAVDGGPALTVNFLTADFVSIGAATAHEAAAVFNRAFAAAEVDAVATVVANAVVLTSDSDGTGSTVTIAGGTSGAVTAFGFVSAAGTNPVPQDNLKVFQTSTNAEVVNGTDLSGTTFTVLVLSK